MRFLDSIKIARKGITLHKSRSVLTILGIVIGIASVVAIMSIGESAEGLVVGEIQRFGPSNVFVLPGREPKGPSDAAGTLLNDSLKIKDYEDMQKKSNIPGARRVVPYAFGYVTASYEAEIYDALTLGSTEYVKRNFDLEVSEGRFFDDFDVENREKVVILGNKVKEELFENKNPIGEKIKIKDQKFKVIGVLSKEGQGSFIDFNKAIIAPYTSVQENILGNRYFNRIIIEANTIEDVPSVIRDVEILLRNNHNIDDPEKDDFWIQTQEDIANRVKTITSILTVLLASVAAISLVVGGVGIMNIMLVSVTERTKEIGLRKALGATNGNILSQFMYEALTLTLIGGILGIILGTGLTVALSYAARRFAGLDFPYVFSINGLLLGVIVSVCIGLIFGVFPARRASKKSPIESLHYE